MNAYRKKLSELYPDHLAEIDRRDAPSVTGAIQKIEDEGVSIQEKKEDGEGREVFIAYVDIRGVSEAGWDYDVIS